MSSRLLIYELRKIKCVHALTSVHMNQPNSVIERTPISVIAIASPPQLGWATIYPLLS